MFGSAHMSIIPAKVAGVKEVIACTPPVKGAGYYPATINAIAKAGADRIFVLGEGFARKALAEMEKQLAVTARVRVERYSDERSS